MSTKRHCDICDTTEGAIGYGNRGFISVDVVSDHDLRTVGGGEFRVRGEYCSIQCLIARLLAVDRNKVSQAVQAHNEVEHP